MRSGDVGGGPGDGDAIDAGCGADADVLLERIATEAGAVADSAEDVPGCGVGLVDLNVDAGAEGDAIGVDAFEAERDPVIPVAGVAVERGLKGVAGLRAAHLFEHVFEAGAVEVSEGDAVTLFAGGRSRRRW